MTRPAPDHAERRRRFEREIVGPSLDASIVTHRPDVRYLTGFSGSSGALFCPPAAAPVLITDFRYEEQAADQVDSAVRVHITRDGLVAALGELVRDAGASRIGFDPVHLTVAEYRKLKEAVPDADWVPTPGVVAAMRAVKSEDEVALIELAIRVAETALERFIGTVDWRAGLTELEITARLELELRHAGSERLPFDVIIASGPRTSLPHAGPGARVPREGDLLLVDWGATVDGYCSDLTRTFVIGAASDWQLELHARVLAAQRAAVEAIAEGADARDVDAAARSRLAEHELDRYFGHSTGHGIGLEVHEEPRLSTRSEDVLSAGNVVTVEPGVYVPGRGGVRIEDDVLVTGSGARRLSGVRHDLVEL